MTSLWAQANLLKLYKVITAADGGGALRNIGVQ
jgi:hypothetical protein